MLVGMTMLAGFTLCSSAILFAAGSHLALGEDVQLRSRAVGLLNQASVVSRFQGGPYNVRTEVTFSATAADGSLQGGSYTRNRGADAALREDLRFGDYSASSIRAGTMAGKTPGWEDPPYAGRMILRLVPFGAGSFDSSDVIEQIKDSSYGGRPAACIEFETIVGEQRLPGEACIDKANGTMLELRTGSKLFEYSDFYAVKGGLFPAQMVYRDGAFSLNATLKLTILEERADDLFAIPTDWTQEYFCKQFQFPVAKVSPQPHGEGAPDAPVTNVAVHLHVSPTGTVSSAEVVRPVRPDLDAEAVKLASQWVFDPGTCDGRAQGFVIDVTLHFQGWRVKDPQP
jgi:TonB family protein